MNPRVVWFPLGVVAAIHCGSDDAATQNDTPDGGPPALRDAQAAPDARRAEDGAAPLDASPIAPPVVDLPRLGPGASELGVLVNTSDPQSVAVAEYYVQKRQIPAANVVRLAFEPPGGTMTPEAFAPLFAEAQAALPATVQGLAITWTQPYLVGGESITTAFAAGYSADYTNTTGGVCGPTKRVPTYDAPTTAPFTDHAIRPTMMLAGVDVEQVKQLVDRGVASDHTFPNGEAWMVRTTDAARSVRYSTFPRVVDAWNGSDLIRATYVDNSEGGGSNVVTDRTGMLFYFQGLASVDGIDTNTYLPGAIADHLTSYGGRVPQSGQMSIVRWLEAGATASYGTAVEPCNYNAKFPAVDVVMRRYVRGEPLLFAYWKSVAWPGEGVFVGEPLATPWGQDVQFEGGTLTLRTTALEPGRTYELRAKSTATDPGTAVQTIAVPPTPTATLTVVTEPNATAPFYALVPASDGG